MKKGPFKMKKFSGFGNESPVKHNQVATEVGAGEVGRMFAVGMSGNRGYKRTADIGYYKDGKFHSRIDEMKGLGKKYANPTGAKIF